MPVNGSPPDNATVYRAPRREPCEERAVVLTAMDIDCAIVPTDDGFALVVPPRQALWAREQLALYEQENPSRSPRYGDHALFSSGFQAAQLYVLVLLLVDIAQKTFAFGLDWLAVGKLQAGLVLQGEWWRAVTALTLHADVPHLLGNLLFGILFGVFVSQLLGPGLAWLSIVLAATAGNLVNAAVQSPDHTAVGASTAVFAALGLLTVYRWTQRHAPDDRPLRRWAPLIAGLILLSLLGVGDARTDITAHLLGFVTGGLLGGLHSWLAKQNWLPLRHQGLLGAGALLLVGGAWLAAWA